MKLYRGLRAEVEGLGRMILFRDFVGFGFHGVDVNGLEWWCEFPDGITRDRAGYVFATRAENLCLQLPKVLSMMQAQLYIDLAGFL